MHSQDVPLDLVDNQQKVKQKQFVVHYPFYHWIFNPQPVPTNPPLFDRETVRTGIIKIAPIGPPACPQIHTLHSLHTHTVRAPPTGLSYRVASNVKRFSGS